jgi:hypothetical protein
MPVNHAGMAICHMPEGNIRNIQPIAIIGRQHSNTRLFRRDIGIGAVHSDAQHRHREQNHKKIPTGATLHVQQTFPSISSQDRPPFYLKR